MSYSMERLLQLKTLKAPFPYFGSKRRIAPLVWERFGNVNHYLEPFAGSAAVLLARPHPLVPYQVETINDLDGEITNVWRSIQMDPEGVIESADWILSELDLHAESSRLSRTRDEFVEWLREDLEHYDASRAGRWIWGTCGMIGSDFDRNYHSIPAVGDKGRGVHTHSIDLRVCRETISRLISPLSERLRSVRVVCGPWERLVTPSVLRPGLKRGSDKITAVFLDPPYMEGSQQYSAGGTRTSLSLDVLSWCKDHGEDPRLRLALCGYAGHYEDLADLGWVCMSWKADGGFGVQSQNKARDNSTREVIWFSPHCLTPEDNLTIIDLLLGHENA